MKLSTFTEIMGSYMTYGLQAGSYIAAQGVHFGRMIFVIKVEGCPLTNHTRTGGFTLHAPRCVRNITAKVEWIGTISTDHVATSVCHLQAMHCPD
jgi:hypothetical protein